MTCASGRAATTPGSSWRATPNWRGRSKRAPGRSWGSRGRRRRRRRPSGRARPAGRPGLFRGTRAPAPRSPRGLPPGHLDNAADAADHGHPPPGSVAFAGQAGVAPRGARRRPPAAGRCRAGDAGRVAATRIRWELREKRVSSAVIDQAVREGLGAGPDLARTEERSAIALVARRLPGYRHLPRDRQVRRLAALLGRRGFDQATIVRALRGLGRAEALEEADG